MLKLHRDRKNRGREPGRDGKILSDHRHQQDGDGNVAVGGVGNLAR